MKQVLGVTERDGKSFWTRIGVGFENKDGSINLKLDFIPTNPDTTIQVRDMPPREDDSPKGESSSGTRGRGPRQAQVVDDDIPF